MPKTLAATQRPKREFETICMAEGEDTRLLHGWVNKAADHLVFLGHSKSGEEVNQHIVNNLSSVFTIQGMSILARPNIPRSEIDDVIRDAHLNDKVENIYIYTWRSDGCDGGGGPS